MYQNPIYICICWYSNICCSPVGVASDSYIFWIFFRLGITVPSFIIAGYVWQILGRGGEGFFAAPFPPHIREHSQKGQSYIRVNAKNTDFFQNTGFKESINMSLEKISK